MLLDVYPTEALPIIESAPVREIAGLIRGARVRRAADILTRLTPETAAQALALLPAGEIGPILVELEPNRAAHLLARLEPEAREEHLSKLDRAMAGELRSLMTYPPDSAGSLMDPRVITFRPDTVVREARQRLRQVRRRRVQDVFVVDEIGRLVGSIPLQNMFLASTNEPLRNVMRVSPPHVEVTASRDAVIEILQQHGSESLPVLDFEGKLLGVLRQRELITTASEEAAAGVVTMTGASVEERALSSPTFAVRKRLGWLQVNLLTAFLAAAVVGIFEDTIARFTALAVLLPVVAGQSGNTGAQALAVTMRGLALREIRVRHWLRVTLKEMIAGSVNGIAVGLTTSVAVYVWSRSTGLALVIGVSMVISMAMAGLAGATIPIALSSLRQDPAQASSIILTTITDVVGFLSFLGIATAFASFL
jgi:magnesium transporter